MTTEEIIISQTKNWVREVVVGCNFCPFAAKELHLGSIHYEVIHAAELEACLEAVILECQRLDKDATIETTLLMFPDGFEVFDDFLELLELAEALIIAQGYEGVYQVASFHPEYCFAGVPANDPANYTNRSLFPTLHLLREESLTRALENYPNPENIPERNIEYARQKGLAHMQLLREACRTNYS